VTVPVTVAFGRAALGRAAFGRAAFGRAAFGRAAFGWCLNSMAESPYFSAINVRLNQLKGTAGNLLESERFS
jgi:hypothetical protein